MPESTIYTVGGTVQAGSGFYIQRKADEELLTLCRAGFFAYVLSPRQMGKSSLVVRATERLSGEGIRSVVIDLTQLGVQVSAEEWYLGLLTMIEEQMTLETNVVKWWQSRSHLGITQRLTQFFQEVLLAEVAAPVVIFVDEIDTTLNLSFTDDFYAAIRYLYNARAHVPSFQRLSFVLIGVATPGDLIRDPQRTPFNIGQRVDVTDWTFEEALPLAAGLGLPPDEARRVLRWVLDWTGGHPYLTQHLCRIIAAEQRENWTEQDVERVVTATFLRGRSEDNNLQFVRDMLTKRAPDPTGTLTVYREIRRGRRPVYDEEQSLTKSHLKLSGVVRRENAVLRVRNSIYGEVFDERWIKEHLPFNWTEQLQLLRRAATALAVVILILLIPLAIYAVYQRNQAMSRASELEASNAKLVLARDEAERQRVLAVAAREEAVQQRRVAEEQRAIAEEQSGIAEKRRTEEEKQRMLATAKQQEAEEQRKRAEEQTRIAEARRKEADEQRALAVAAKADADEQRALAVAEGKKAEQQRDLARGQHQVAVARQLSEQAERSLPENALHAEMYFARALTLDDRPETRERLLEARIKSPRLIWEKPVESSNVRFSPDWNYYAVPGADQTIQIGDSETGEVIRSLAGAAKSFNPKFIFSADGRFLVAQGEDGAGKILEITTGKESKLISLPPNSTIKTFNPATRRMSVHISAISTTTTRTNATGVTVSSGPERFIVLDMDTGKEVATLPLALDSSESDISSDQHKIAVMMNDGTFKVWDLNTGQLLHDLPYRRRGSVTAIAFSRDGVKLAAATYSQIKIWDLSQENRSFEIEVPSNNTTSSIRLAFSRDGKQLAAASPGSIKIWDTESEKELHSFANKQTTVGTVAFSPDKRHLLVSDSSTPSSIGRITHLWDVESGDISFTITNASSLGFTPSGAKLLSTSLGKIKAWDIKPGKGGSLLFGHRDMVASVAFSADGRWLASGSADATIKLWDARSGQEVGTFRGHEGPVVYVAFNRTGQRLFSAGLDPDEERGVQFKLWDVETREEIKSRSFTYQEPKQGRIIDVYAGKIITDDRDKDFITILDWETGKTVSIPAQVSTRQRNLSTDGKRLAAEAEKGAVKIWDTDTGKELTAIPTGSNNSVSSVALSQDNRRLAVASGSEVWVWDIATGKRLSAFTKISFAVDDLTFSHDGQWLAAAGDGRVKIWDVETGKLLRTLVGGESRYNLAFSSDKRWLLSGGRDVSLWDLADETSNAGFDLPGRLTERLEYGVMFSPDGRTLAYGDQERRVRLWNLDALRQVREAEHWALFKQIKSETPYRVAGLDLDFIPQITLRKTLGEQYDPVFSLLPASEVGPSVEERDRADEEREKASGPPPTVKKRYVPTGEEGTISGQVNFTGHTPPPKAIDMSADPVCVKSNPNPSTQDSIVNDGRLANVFVYVRSGSALNNLVFETPTSDVGLQRKGCETVPRLLGLQTHQVLTIQNNDATAHNFNAQPTINSMWNLSIAVSGPPIYREFDYAETFIPIRCNQHPWERSWIGVFEHPFFAVSDMSGAYTIAGLPPGTYTVVAWHEKYGEQVLEEITVGAKEAKTLDFTFTAVQVNPKEIPSNDAISGK